MNDTAAKVRKKKDWGNDPQWVQLKPLFEAWHHELPAELQVTYPPDGSPPWLASHFVGNMHSYYELSVVILHRPQLAASDAVTLDGEWKHHMVMCYSAAKNLCRLQEAVLSGFGLSGLRCMQRGLGFSIYAILTCTVLHLVRFICMGERRNDTNERLTWRNRLQSPHRMRSFTVMRPTISLGTCVCSNSVSISGPCHTSKRRLMPFERRFRLTRVNHLCLSDLFLIRVRS